MYKKSRINLQGKEATLFEGLGKYNLRDTMQAGQCFRYEEIQGGEYLSEYQTVVGERLLHVAQRRVGELIVFDLTEDEAQNIAVPYFALERDLRAVKESITERTDSEWLKRAAEEAEGIAILRQEPFETLISFIISQNNNIPRIRKIIREICAEYGVNLALQNGLQKCPLSLIDTTPCQEKCKSCGRCYTFPCAEDILRRPEGLLPSHPGFRYGYIIDACRLVKEGVCDLSAIAEANSYAYTLEELKKIKGVGDKVASCVALFGFANLEAFPIDVWMKRAIDTYFDGRLDPHTLGEYAGIAQQYIFHYIRNVEGGRTN